MKFVITLIAAIAAVCLTGCFHASKKHESLHSLKVKEVFHGDGTIASSTSKELWRDKSRGGGGAVLADPAASQIESDNANQTALGGGSALNVGDVSSVVSDEGIKATGGAVGEGARAFAGIPDLKRGGNAIKWQKVIKIGDVIYTLYQGGLYIDEDNKLYILVDGQMVLQP